MMPILELYICYCYLLMFDVFILCTQMRPMTEPSDQQLMGEVKVKFS